MHWKILYPTDFSQQQARPQRLVHLFFICLFTFFLIPLDSHANNETKNLVYKLWDINSNDRLLADIKKSLLSGEENLLTGLEKEQGQKISQIVDENFAEIKSQMLQYMAKNGRASTLTRANNWLTTPLGKKVSHMEIAVQTLFNDPESAWPVDKPDLSAERSTLLSKYEKLSFTPASTVQKETVEHFIYLLNHTRPPGERLSDKEVDQAAKLAGVKTSAITTQALPHIFKRAFSNLSLEELTVYLNFMDSEAGRAYTDLFIDAYIHALATTRSGTLLKMSRLFEDELSVLSPYSTVKLDDNRQRELMALLIKRYGIQTIIRAMMEAGTGQMTIVYQDDTKLVYGRPDHKLVTLDTLMADLQRSGKDIRQFYKIVQKKLR